MIDPVDRIPKVIIGNPETKGIAFDFIPNYHPYFTPNVTLRNGRVYYGEIPLHLSAQEQFLLTRCDGCHSVYALTMDFAQAFQLADRDEAAVLVFDRLKWGRSLGLIRRDNAFGPDGLFIRIRQFKTDECEERRWFYLPPFAQRVLTLASGAFSCREIAAQIRSEFESGTHQYPGLEELEQSTVEDTVVETCQFLIGIGVVAWIDDEENRQKRLTEFLEQSMKTIGGATYDHERSSGQDSGRVSVS
jgi:hypothetical protein